MKYKAVLLDADDTVFDFKLSERTAFHQAADAMGIPPTEGLYESYHAINDSLWKALERGEVEKDRLRVLRFELLAERFALSLDGVRMNEIYGGMLSANHHLLPGAKEFLKELSGRCKIYLATNGIAQVQRRRASEAGITPYLDGMFISEELGANKPARAYYDALLAAIAPIGATDCIAFGDSLSSDIAGAVGAGIDSCWFNPCGEAEGSISPTYTVGTYAQFLSILGE